LKERKSKKKLLCPCRKTPLASASAAVGSYLPDRVSELWEPQRDIAHAKLPVAIKGYKTICALIGSGRQVESSGGRDAMGSGVGSNADDGSGNGVVDSNEGLGGNERNASQSGTLIGGGVGAKEQEQLKNLMLLVVTTAGYFYQYAVDLEAGGECILLKEFSLLEN
jgi:hypothetical protein